MNKKKIMQFAVKTALMDNSRIKEACQVLMEIGQPVLAHYLEKYGNRKEQHSEQELYFILKQHAQFMTNEEEKQYEMLKKLKRAIFETTKKTTRSIIFDEATYKSIEFERTKDGKVGDITYHMYEYIIDNPMPFVYTTMETPPYEHLRSMCMKIKGII